MSRNKTMERFFDEEDFTVSHDEIFEHLISHWQDYIIPLVMNRGFPAEIRNAEILGEPALDGYPPLFPDAIATGTVYEDHKKVPAVLKYDSEADEVGAYCGKCENFLDTITFDKRSYDTEGKNDWQKKFDALVDDWKQRPRLPTNLCRLFCFRAVFEIKPHSESAGRILHQLNIYRARLEQRRYSDDSYGKEYMILITPDARFDDLFQKQGVIPMRPLLSKKENDEQQETGGKT